MDALDALVALVSFVAFDTLNTLGALDALDALLAPIAFIALIALIALIAFIALFSLLAHGLDIEGLPAAPIVVGNIPDAVLADFQPGGDTVGSVFSVFSIFSVADDPVAAVMITEPPIAVVTDVGRQAFLPGGPHRGVHTADPPVAVFSDERGLGIFAAIPLLVTFLRGFVAGVLAVDPPVAVFTDFRGEALLCGAFGGYAGIGIPNPPVAIVPDDRCLGILALFSVLSGGGNAGIGFPNPPVAVVPNGRGRAARTVLIFIPRGLVTGIIRTNPPIPVVADIGGLTFFVLTALLPGGGDAGIQLPQPPVAILTDGGGHGLRRHGPIAGILAVNNPVAVSSDFRNVADGPDLGVYVPDPPIAVVADEGGIAVFALLAVLAVGARGPDLGVRQADPPVAVFSDVGGIAVFSVLSVLPGGLDPGIGIPDPPVAVAADIRRAVRPVVDLVGPDAFQVFPILCGYARQDEGIFTTNIQVRDRVFPGFRGQLLRYFRIAAARNLVDIEPGDLRAALFPLRHRPGQGDGLVLRINDAVQVRDRVRRGREIGNAIADKGRLIALRAAQVPLPLAQVPMEAVGIHHRGRDALRHQALLVNAGNGAAGTYRGAFRGGVALAVGILEAGGHAELGAVIFHSPLDGAVEEEAVGHLHAFGGGVLLGPGHLVQRPVIAQGELRLADGPGVEVRVAPAVVVVAVGISLVALQPVFGGVDLMQLIACGAARPVGNILVVFRRKSVVGAHGHLLVDRPLGDGGLHHGLVVPGPVGVLNVVFIDEHRRAVDHHAVVGLGGKALAPLLI